MNPKLYFNLEKEYCIAPLQLAACLSSKAKCWFKKIKKSPSKLNQRGQCWVVLLRDVCGVFNASCFDTLFSSVLTPETPMQLEETVEVVTTEVLEKDRPSSPLAQSPPAESSTGPSVPASGEVKNRSANSQSCLKQTEGKLFLGLGSCSQAL